MTQTIITIRFDSELKKKFELLCEEFGMSIDTAFNLFVKEVVRNQSLPFDIEVKNKNLPETGMAAFLKLREQAKELPEMTLEEINKEISAYRSSKHGQTNLCCD